MRGVDQKVLTDINLSGDTMRLPFQVRLPIWAPPSMVASSASCHPRHDRKIRLTPLDYGGPADFDIQALPVHHALLDATDSLSWKFARGQLRERSDFESPIELRLTFKPKGSLEFRGVTIADVQIVPTPVGPTKARVTVTVFARKFPLGVFPLASVDDVPLKDDATSWSTAIRKRLAEEMATAKLPDGTTFYTDFISTALDTWLSP